MFLFHAVVGKTSLLLGMLANTGTSWPKKFDLLEGITGLTPLWKCTLLTLTPTRWHVVSQRCYFQLLLPNLWTHPLKKNTIKKDNQWAIQSQSVCSCSKCALLQHRGSADSRCRTAQFATRVFGCFGVFFLSIHFNAPDWPHTDMTVFDRFLLQTHSNQEHAQCWVKIKVAWFVLIKQPLNPCQASHTAVPLEATQRFHCDTAGLCCPVVVWKTRCDRMTDWLPTFDYWHTRFAFELAVHFYERHVQQFRNITLVGLTAETKVWSLPFCWTQCFSLA